MIKYLMGSMVLIMLPVQAAQYPPISDFPGQEYAGSEFRKGKHIGLLSKRFYRRCRSQGGGKISVEPLQERFASLTALYNQLETLHRNTINSNKKLEAQNKMLQRVAFDRNPHYEVEYPRAPRFGDIVISSQNTTVQTTTTIGDTTTTTTTSAVSHTISVPVRV